MLIHNQITVIIIIGRERDQETKTFTCADKTMILGILTLTLGLTELTQPVSGEQNSPVFTTKWNGLTKIQGAYLITPIEFKTLKQICKQMPKHINLGSQAVSILNKSQYELGENSFIRKISFLLLHMESTFENILNYVEKLSLCNWDYISRMRGEYRVFKNKLDQSWIQLRKQKQLEVATKLQQARPIMKPREFPAIIGGLGIGLLGGVMLGSIFGSNANDNAEKIETLNRNINKINKKVLITNERLDVLSNNVTTAISEIKTILDKMQTFTTSAEIRKIVEWQLNQVIDAAITAQNIFRLGETSITMLRAGILNLDLIELETFKKVIQEGTKVFPDLEFPIGKISKENLPDIVKIIRIENIGGNKFVAVIPLVKQIGFDTYELIPLPVRVHHKMIMIAETKNTVLRNDQHYIITDKEDLVRLSNTTLMLNKINPLWDRSRKSCESEAVAKNVTGMMELCHFKKLNTNNNIFLAKTQNNRIIFLEEKTMVTLNCPDGKIKSALVGLHMIPPKCDVETEQVTWPAEQTEKVELKSLLDENEPFDITEIPILSLNDTLNVHKTIKTLIKELPSEREAFTFEFKDFSLEEVQSYTIIGYGIHSIVIIINSILIGILYLLRGKKYVRKFDSISGLNLRESIRNKVSRDSLRATEQWRRMRASLRKGKNKLRKTRDSLRELRKPRDMEEGSKTVGTNTPIQNNEYKVDFGNYVEQNYGPNHNEYTRRDWKPTAPPLPSY